MPRLWFVSWRYWSRRPARGATTVIGVALGVALVVAVGLINESIVRAYVDLTEALAGRAQLEVRALTDAGMSERWLQVVAEFDGVAEAVPLLERRSFLFVGDRNLPLLVRGVDPARDGLVRPLEVTAGRPLEPDDGAAMLLAEPLVASLGVEVGDSVQLLTPEGFADFRLVGVFAGLDPLSAPQSRVAVVPLAALQEAYLGRAAVSQIDVTVAADTEVDVVADELADVLSSIAFVQRPVEQARKVAELTHGVRFMLLLASVVALVAAAYLIANNVLAAVNERQHDLATVRALGLSRRTVTGWLLAEVAALGVVGSAVGAALGALAAEGVARGLSLQLLAPFVFDLGRLELRWPVLASGFVIGVGTALVAAYPAVHWVAGRNLGRSLNLGQVLAGTSHPDRRRRHPLSLATGVLASVLGGLLLQVSFTPTRAWSLASLSVVLLALLTVAAYLPVVLGSLGASLRTLPASPLWLRLAADSLRRHHRRTGAVAASLMITLAILVGVFGMVRSYRASVSHWVDEMFGWDLMVSSATQGLRAAVPLSETLEAELEQLPGVKLASPERVVLAAHGAAAVTLYAYDMATFRRLRRFNTVAGVPGEMLPGALAGRRRVAVSSTLAPRFGLEVGEMMTLTTPSGPVDYQVAAIVQDPGALSGAVYLDRSIYLRDWGDHSVDSFALLLEPGADPAAVAELLTTHFADRFPLQVVSAATFKDGVDRMVLQTFGLSQGLVLMAVLVALFGLMNAGLVGAWQLRRQLAVLRALGAPPGLLSRALLAEAWLTSALGGAVGLVMGTLLSVVLLRTMQFTSSLAVTWSWPLQAYALVAAIALLGSLAVGYLPSRAAERTKLAEALRYE